MKRPEAPPRPNEIADIHIGRAYDPRDPEGEIHYETFARLAAFFGRNTPVHRHHAFFQIHVLTRGAIHLDLDGSAHGGPAPAIVFTPPNVPHSFYSDEDTDGHVLTLRQDVVRDWLRDMAGAWPDDLLREPAFVTVAAEEEERAAEFAALVAIAELVERESSGDRVGRKPAMKALAQCFLVPLARLTTGRRPQASAGRSRAADVALFMRFCVSMTIVPTGSAVW